MKCSERKHLPGTIQVNPSRKTSGHWIVCVRHNSDYSKLAEARAANQVNQVNHLDGHNRLVTCGNVRHRLPRVNAKSLKTWRISHVAVDKMARTRILKKHENSWRNERIRSLTPSIIFNKILRKQLAISDKAKARVNNARRGS